jgi:hypothetical protein
MENDSCLGEYLYADDLTKMVEESNTNLDFVFMATCHSETAAKIFMNAGARHVIGINKDNSVLDEAVLTFSSTFYNMLWKSRSKICNCFH